MSDFIIKHYEKDKGLEEAQAKLGTEQTKDWGEFGQTPAENLKQYYSVEGFDPETRLYAFKDNKLVGFMVSRVLPDAEDGIKRAQHDFPLAENDSEEIGKALYNKGIEILKKKGVKVLEARVGENWGKTKELAERLGYKEARVHYLRTEVDLKDIDVKVDKNPYREFDAVKDKEPIVKMFVKQFNMSEEQAEANFKGIVDNVDAKYFMPIIREGDEIVSRGLAYKQEDNPNASFRFLVPNPKKEFDAYLALVTEFAKKSGAEKFELFFGGPNLESLDFYTKYGFKVTGKVFIYEKEI